MDMAYRLHVEGIENTLVNNFDEAIALVKNKEVSVLAAYTAFFELVM